MRRILTMLVIVACGSAAKPPVAPTPPPPTTPTAPAAAKRLVLVDEAGVGLGGHDPIAYRTDEKAVEGTGTHTSAHEGATYWFASAEHKATFDGDAKKHAPQYGGYCAYAASLDRVSESDPTVFQIVDGQLLVFTNKSYKLQFNADVAGNKAKADTNWPGLVEKYGK
jgi:YHS domain-containing protein